MDDDHERLVSLTASDEVNLLTRSCMANCSAAWLTRGCPLTCRSEAFLAHLLCDRPLRYSRYQGIPTPLSTLAVTGRYQLSPYYAEVDHLWEAVQGETNTPKVAQIYLGDTNTPVLKQQRDCHLFSVSPTACTEPNTYLALVWHCTQRIPYPDIKCLSSIAQFYSYISYTKLLHRFICATKAPFS